LCNLNFLPFLMKYEHTTRSRKNFSSPCDATLLLHARALVLLPQAMIAVLAQVACAPAVVLVHALVVVAAHATAPLTAAQLPTPASA
jgi:hypothetical protein